MSPSGSSRWRATATAASRFAWSRGAYWDAEIKRGQELGLEDYAVFTRRANTDLCYEVCAATFLNAPDAIYPQFATHNAQTISTVLALAPEGAEFEFQRLHGMGELLYAHLRGRMKQTPPLRVYAPVGAHRDLLPYLVRRLLENGANSSFVNRFLDADTPVAQLVPDTLEAVRGEPTRRHPRIPKPADILHAAGETRAPAAGADLDEPHDAKRLLATLGSALGDAALQAGPIIGGRMRTKGGVPVYCPANRQRVVGHAAAAQRQDVDAALRLAAAAQPGWDGLGGERARACWNRRPMGWNPPRRG